MTKNGTFKEFLPPNAIPLDLRELKTEEIIRLMSEAGWTYQSKPYISRSDRTLISEQHPETMALAFDQN